MKEDLNNSQK